MSRYIDLDELLKFPIRIDHYDKEHGDINFIYGIESVIEYAEYLPVYEVLPDGKWYSETETASLIETLQKENEALKNKLNGSNELSKTAVGELTIEKLKQYWKFKFDRAKGTFDKDWFPENKREHREYLENINHTLKALDEIEDLKKYLKLAVRDAGFYESEHCSCYHTSRCSNDCTDSEDCVFKYADKVEKLIGGTEDERTS